MIPERLNILKYWIEEREKVRTKKEYGLPKPWTSDRTLQTYRFCNVHREDDLVTRWIKQNWRDPYDGNPNMILAMATARLVNWPDTLAELGFPEIWNRKHFIDTIAARKERGEKAWTGAYMITAEMGVGAPSKEVSVAKTLDWFAVEWDTTGATCKELWLEFQGAPRVGSFISAQIVADLKHTSVLRGAPDRDTFCAPGPGSMSGLNWLLGRNILNHWNQPDFEHEVNVLRAEVAGVEVVDAQDMQNCLCEIFKYQRGSSRSKYPGGK